MERSAKKIDKTLLFLITIVSLVLLAVFLKGGVWLTIEGLAQTGRLMQMVWLRLLLGFTLGGLIQVLLPKDLIARWLGPTSGVKGLLIGSYIGIILSGGPYVIMPVIASIYGAGAGVGPIIALLIGRVMLGIREFFVWEIPFFGVGLPISRYIVALFIPPFAGLAGAAVYRLMNRKAGTAVRMDDNTGEGEQ